MAARYIAPLTRHKAKLLCIQNRLLFAKTTLPQF